MEQEFNEELLIKEVRKIGVKLAEISSEVNNYFSSKVTPKIYKNIQDLLAKHTLIVVKNIKKNIIIIIEKKFY